MKNNKWILPDGFCFSDWKNAEKAYGPYDNPPKSPGVYLIIRKIFGDEGLRVHIMYAGSTNNLQKCRDGSTVFYKVKREYCDDSVDFLFKETANHRVEVKELIQLLKPELNRNHRLPPILPRQNTQQRTHPITQQL